MLCLHDSIRYDDPAVQRLLSAVEHVPYLTALILATWSACLSARQSGRAFSRLTTGDDDLPIGVRG